MLDDSTMVPEFLELSAEECSASRMLLSFADVLFLGDRFELLCAAASALVMKIPIVHIHGGEAERAFDEAIRHSITKMSASFCCG